MSKTQDNKENSKINIIDLYKCEKCNQLCEFKICPNSYKITLICPKQENHEKEDKIEDINSIQNKTLNSGLLSNISISDFLDIKNKTKQEISCSNCTEIFEKYTQNFSICDECSQIFCKNCKKKHYNEKDHETYTCLQKKNCKCPIHNSDHILYCTECKEDLCILCKEKHEEHLLEDLSKYFYKQTQIDENKKDLKNEEEKMNSAINLLETYKGEFIKNIEIIKETLRQAMQLKKNIINQFELENSFSRNQLINYKTISDFHILSQELEKFVEDTNWINKGINLLLAMSYIKGLEAKEDNILSKYQQNIEHLNKQETYYKKYIEDKTLIENVNLFKELELSINIKALEMMDFNTLVVAGTEMTAILNLEKLHNANLKIDEGEEISMQENYCCLLEIGGCFVKSLSQDTLALFKEQQINIIRIQSQKYTSFLNTKNCSLKNKRYLNPSFTTLTSDVYIDHEIIQSFCPENYTGQCVNGVYIPSQNIFIVLDNVYIFVLNVEKDTFKMSEFKILKMTSRIDSLVQVSETQIFLGCAQEKAIKIIDTTNWESINVINEVPIFPSNGSLTKLNEGIVAALCKQPEKDFGAKEICLISIGDYKIIQKIVFRESIISIDAIQKNQILCLGGTKYNKFNQYNEYVKWNLIQYKYEEESDKGDYDRRMVKISRKPINYSPFMKLFHEAKLLFTYENTGLSIFK